MEANREPNNWTFGDDPLRSFTGGLAAKKLLIRTETGVNFPKNGKTCAAYHNFRLLSSDGKVLPQWLTGES
jgi:hypothetical protein